MTGSTENGSCRTARIVRPPPQGLSRGKRTLSTSNTRACARARRYAVVAPAGPAPTTATSKRSTGPRLQWPSAQGGVPERPKGTGCKPVGSAYGGSNPPAPTLGLSEEVAHHLEVAVAFLQHRGVRALLEDDLAGAADAVDELGRDRVGAHVVATADDEGREVDLVQPAACVPAFERAGRRPLVRPLHRAVDVRCLLRGHRLELGARLRPAVEVTVEVHLHRFFVLRIVVASGLLVMVENFDHLRWERGSQDELLLVPEGEVRQCGAEDETDDSVRAGEHMLLGEHSSPGRAEQVNPLEPELVAHGSHLLAEDLDAPLDALRPIRLAAADLVVEHDRPFVCKLLERREVVVRRPRSAVQREQRRHGRIEIADEAVPRPIAAEIDVSLARLYPGYHPLAPALLAQLVAHLHGKSARRGNGGVCRGWLSR